jgi:hypothetical protein
MELLMKEEPQVSTGEVAAAEYLKVYEKCLLFIHAERTYFKVHYYFK